MKNNILISAAVAAICLSSCSDKSFDEKHITASFGVMSDVHISALDSEPARKFTIALAQLRDLAAKTDPDGLDGILVAGDLVDKAYASIDNYVQVDWFKQLYESVLDPTEVPLVYTPGNHDVYKEWTPDAIAQAQTFSQHFSEEYFLHDVDMQAKATLECRHCIVSGYHVLTILPVGRNPVVYTDEQKAWLDKTLAEITAKDKKHYVLLLTHPMITDTVYGGTLGDYWATSDLTDILNKYPQVVTFGGHLHFPLNDPRSIWQGDFTAMGCGSVRYMAIENGGYEYMSSKTVMKDANEFSQGLLLQFDRRGNMRATRMDFYHDSTIGEPWVSMAPAKDNSHLERWSHDLRRSANTAPVISDLDVKLEAEEIVVTFSSAQDDEFAHHYVVTISDSEGTEISVKKILADFYRVDDPAEMKPEWTVPFDALEPGTYKVTLVAVDSWDAVSNTLTKEFTVGN